MIAIMQGRLSPPINGRIQSFPTGIWAEEFARAADAGLDAIEWIFDALDNPILVDAGVTRINALSKQTGIRISSICADYFMDAPLHRATDAQAAERVATLRALIDGARAVGARHIVVPCVDQSSIVDDSDRHQLVQHLGVANAYAEAHGVELHLETGLPPNDFSSLLAGLPDTVRANYDSGNSASLGYDVTEEFASYGERVGSVHIKDRVRGGSTVALGLGDANFVALFEALGRANYRGVFTLQVARGTAGDEVHLARQNRAFVLDRLKPTDQRS